MNRESVLQLKKHCLKTLASTSLYVFQTHRNGADQRKKSRDLQLHLEPQIWLSDTVRSAISKQTHYHHKGSRTRSYDLGPDIKKETLQKHMRPASHEDTPYTKHIQWCAWCIYPLQLAGYKKNNALNNTCMWWHVVAVWSDLVDDVSDFPHDFFDTDN